MKTVLFLALAVAAAQDSLKREFVNYVVGPGDVLTVTCSTSRSCRDGSGSRTTDSSTIRFSDASRPAADRRQIAALLKNELADGYLRDPQVTVDVEQFRSQNVFVMGEVRAPGRYTLTGSVTLVEALAQAGSTAATAGSEILILRSKRPVNGSSDRRPFPRTPMPTCSG